MKKAFTLVELIVGITISMLLMVSVGVFVSSGMSNITLQKKVLDDNKKVSSDILYLQKYILNSKKYISNIGTYTGILLRQNKYFDKGGFSYIGVKTFSNKYCQPGSEITDTNHLYVSNFIPLDGVSIDSGNYKTDISKHQVIRKSDNKIVVGKDIFGNKLSDGDYGTGVFLNSPTAIVEIDGKAVFSDTLNDRILYLSGSKVYTLLDENDGIEEPIGLAYNSSEKVLYIANAGKGEILKYSSKTISSNPDLKIEGVNQTSIDKMEIEINTSENLVNPIDYSKFNFYPNVQSSNDYVELENNKIKYYFLDNYSNNQTRSECYGKHSGDIILDYPNKSIKCTNNTGSGELANFRNVSFYNEDIIVSDIKPDFIENKNYYVKLNLFENDNGKYEKYHPYFTKGDNDIFTKKDNTLELIQDLLNYPFKVNDDGTYTDFNSNTYNYSVLTPDFIFSNPIKNLEKNYNNGLLNLKINYYKYLNCYNVDDKIERSFLINNNFINKHIILSFDNGKDFYPRNTYGIKRNSHGIWAQGITQIDNFYLISQNLKEKNNKGKYVEKYTLFNIFNKNGKSIGNIQIDYKSHAQDLSIEKISNNKYYIYTRSSDGHGIARFLLNTSNIDFSLNGSNKKLNISFDKEFTIDNSIKNITSSINEEKNKFVSLGYINSKKEKIVINQNNSSLSKIKDFIFDIDFKNNGGYNQGIAMKGNIIYILRGNGLADNNSIKQLFLVDYNTGKLLKNYSFMIEPKFNYYRIEPEGLLIKNNVLYVIMPTRPNYNINIRNIKLYKLLDL